MRVPAMLASRGRARERRHKAAAVAMTKVASAMSNPAQATSQ